MNRYRKTVPFGLAVILACLTGIAGASIITQPPESGSEAAPRDLQPKRETARIVATASDIEPGLPWGLQLSKSKTDKNCLVVGRVKDGQLGIVDENGFKPFPPLPSASCGALPASNGKGDNAQVGFFSQRGRLVFYGLGNSDVRRVTLAGPGGSSEELASQPNKGFIAVRVGDPDDAEKYPLTVETKDGAKRTYTWGGPPTNG